MIACGTLESQRLKPHLDSMTGTAGPHFQR